MMRSGRRIRIRGTVQGVGLRPWVYRLARDHELAGRVRNDGQGVTIDAFGPEPTIARFLERLRGQPPPAAQLRELVAQPIPPEDLEDFMIVESGADGAKLVSIPPDLATCPECLAELLDPADRRHRYPFTNCTHCGPRFTIACAVPYDRAATTMAAFAMCRECAREYADPSNRRFHAQPNACPQCGPRVWLMDPSGDPIASDDPIADAACALRRGAIVAVKGLGGYHLACDATAPDAVARLRRRKRREQKPLAVMVRDLELARELAELEPRELELLTGVERPIVLVRRRAGANLAAEVAPGNPLVGLFLPYTPLHHLLLRAAARPLVMTSGNRSDEPIAHREAEAIERLGPIADLLLAHDREIENRCDDSVARIIAGRPTLLRRARGYVPRGLALARPLARPVLACGAQLKNTFCLARDQVAYLGPHIGDLETLETLSYFEESVARLERFLDIEPEVIAYDLHPDYLSSAYARARPEALKVGVQHHHAHVVSCMAEHGLDGPVLGVAYDGTGYGPDGAAWGGELLLVEPHRYQRLATWRPLRLAGGDQAIREVWRLALAALLDAYDGRPPLAELKLFQRQPQQTVANVRLLLGPEARAPRAHGLGRWFDAFGALVLGRPIAHFEGQVAIEWNLIADPVEAGVYPFELSDGEPMIVDPRPMVRAACAELLRGVAPARISARFHNTVGAATAALVERAAGRVGRMPVVLTGGCFQNARLAEGLLAELSEEFEVFAHGSVPPGDGGLALGQALIADAVLRSRAFSSAGGGGRPCPPAAAGGGGRPCPPGAGDGRLCSRVESRS